MANEAGQSRQLQADQVAPRHVCVVRLELVDIDWLVLFGHDLTAQNEKVVGQDIARNAENSSQ